MENYTDKEFANSFLGIYEDLINGKNKNQIKKAFILGGQPGAGKSRLTSLIEKNNEVIVINGDDFRSSHPHYEELRKKYGDNYVLHTQEFSAKMTEMLIKKLSDDGYNLIIEGSLRTAEVPINTCKLLKNKGYIVDLDVVQVRPEISLLGTFQRYEKMLEVGTVARETPIEHHNNVVSNLPKNLDYIYNENIFDNIEIFSRNGEKIYSQKETPIINPGNIFKDFFDRKLLDSEKEFLNKNYDVVLESMKKRNAPQEQISKVMEVRKRIEEKVTTNNKERHKRTRPIRGKLEEKEK